MDLYKYISRADVMKMLENNKELDIMYLPTSFEIKDTSWIMCSPSWNWASNYYLIGEKTKDNLYIHELLWEAFENNKSIMYFNTEYHTIQQKKELISLILKNPKSVIPKCELIKTDEYRPCETIEEALRFLNTSVKFKGDNIYRVITGVSDSPAKGLSMYINTVEYNFDVIFNECETLDGKPIGIKIG